MFGSLVHYPQYYDYVGISFLVLIKNQEKGEKGHTRTNLIIYGCLEPMEKRHLFVTFTRRKLEAHVL